MTSHPMILAMKDERESLIPPLRSMSKSPSRWAALSRFTARKILRKTILRTAARTMPTMRSAREVRKLGMNVRNFS
ncbi:MAG: hypothetical protein A4E61_01332 [Syntrophorhabdus sp. PtaB.Bin184]|nr:MAG: hypothetical protein A4E61_01332 [Syntrophorhabdus sp. PtaB.Bin184]